MPRLFRFYHVKSHKIIESASETFPLPRSGHRIVSDEKNLYLIGGYVQYPNEKLAVEGEIWKFNFFTHNWTKLDIPTSTFRLGASHAAVKVDDDIIIHGGTGTVFGKEVDNSLIVINIKTLFCYEMEGKAKDGDPNNFPIPTYGHSLNYTKIDGVPYLYKFGGAMGNVYSHSMYRYNIEQHYWEKVYPLRDYDIYRDEVEAKYRHDSFIWNNKLYLFGGCNLNKVFSFNPVSVFDLIEKKWSTITFKGGVPKNIKYQSAAQDGNLIYICGGLKTKRVRTNRLVYRYNLEDQTCSIIARQPMASYFNDCTFAPKIRHLYSFGGVIGNDPIVRTNSLHEFILADQPKRLDELAWQALQPILKLSRQKNLDKFAKTQSSQLTNFQSASELVMAVIQRIEDSLIAHPEKKFIIQPSHAVPNTHVENMAQEVANSSSSHASASSESSWSGSQITTEEEEEVNNQEDINDDIESEDRYSYQVSNESNNRNVSPTVPTNNARANNSLNIEIPYLVGNLHNPLVNNPRIQYLVFGEDAVNFQPPHLHDNTLSLSSSSTDEQPSNNNIQPIIRYNNTLHRIIRDISPNRRISVFINTNDDSITDQSSTEDEDDEVDVNEASEEEANRSTIESFNSQLTNTSRPNSLETSSNSNIHQQLIQLQRWITAIRRLWSNGSPSHYLPSVNGDLNSLSTVGTNSSTGATGGGASIFADAAGHREEGTSRNVYNGHPLVTDEALVVILLYILGVPTPFIERIERAQLIIKLTQSVFKTNESLSIENCEKIIKTFVSA